MGTNQTTGMVITVNRNPKKNKLNDDYLRTSNSTIQINNLSLGINIGGAKTVYSSFTIENGKLTTKVLLMNRASRIIPSIICYSNTHRLFGENSKSSLKQNLDSSYNNLSRLIGFDKNEPIFQDELKYMYINENKNIKNIKFYCKSNNNKEEIESECIIADFIYLINQYYYKEEKKDNVNISISFSVPDFFTETQKKKLNIICESIGMKNIKVYNESSAITMYYGYTKYRDLFVLEKKIDPTIEKYILFIDIGHSKTSFILSYFKYNIFEVKYVECIPNIGGRNFDELIYNYCIKKFKKKKKLNDIKISPKMRYRLLEQITKKRNQLTVNNEILITVESFYVGNNIEEDLEIIISRETFEKLIGNLVKEIIKILDNLIKKNNNIKIDYVEIAGELMRTPILQNLIKKQYNLTISKTILIDECTSVGSSLLDYFFRNKENFPIVKLNHFIEFSNDKKDKSQNINFNSLSNKIKEHISKFNKLDDIYYKFINFKNDNLKILYFLKDYFRNNDDIKKKINEIEKNIKGNNGNLNSLENDEKNIKNIVFLLIDELIQNSEIKEKTKSILQNMKNEKKFNFKEFKKIYEQLNLKSF